MLFLLIHSFRDWLEDHRLGFLRVFTFVSFQASVAIMVGFLAVVLLGGRFIAWLQRQKIGDQAEFDQAEINAMMLGKRGTPTMGGVLILAAITLATVLLANLGNFYVQAALISLLLLGACGALDDWLKLTAARRTGSRQGLNSREKFWFQIGLTAILSAFTFRWGRLREPATHLYVPFFKDVAIPLNLWSYTLIGTLVMTGASNAVNLTDGLDGLAAGCMALVSFSFMILALIVGDPTLSHYLHMPILAEAGEMAVLAGAMGGACLGFLWFNCNPASVFMGDTGSLALGGLIGYIALVIRHEIVLFLIGGIFVAEACSVMIQVGYFKYSRRRFGEGRRIFLMAPLHHHFQRKGWTETQVVTRFWLIGAMLAALGLATVKLR